jgi:hypothetical protein
MTYLLTGGHLSYSLKGGKGNSLIPPLRFPYGRFGGIRSFLRVN